MTRDAKHATSRDRRRIAFLVNSLDSEYAQVLWHAVRRAAAQHNAEVMAFTGMYVGSPDPSQSTRNHIYDLVSPLRLDGVVLASSLIAHQCGVEGIANLCRHYAPMPVCSVGLEVPGICSLVVDNRAGMAQGVRHLIETHGCRKIAFLAAQPTSPESNLRLLGYYDALREFDVPIDEHLIFHSDFTTPGGRAVTRQLLASGHQFDAIVAANDYMAIGALEVLEAAGISVPRDLAVCGFDDSSDAAAYRPALTTLRQPAGWLGVTAVELILAQLDGETAQACHTGAVDLVRRESCGCSYSVEASVRPIEVEPPTVMDVLRSQKIRLCAVLVDTILDPTGALDDWSTELVNALQVQLVEGRKRL